MNYKPPILRTFSLSCLLLITLALLASVAYVNHILPEARSSTSGTTGKSYQKRQDEVTRFGSATMVENVTITHVYTTPTCMATTLHSTVSTYCTEGYGCIEYCQNIYNVTIFFTTSGQLASVSIPTTPPGKRECLQPMPPLCYRVPTTAASRSSYHDGSILGPFEMLTVLPTVTCSSDPFFTTEWCWNTHGYVEDCWPGYSIAIYVNDLDMVTSASIISGRTEPITCLITQNEVFYLHLSTTSSTTPPLPTSPSPHATITNPTQTVSTGSPTLTSANANLTPPSNFTEGDWFLGNYLPLVVAVLYRILWTYVYTNIKLMEPFFQMSSPNGGGVLAKNILRVDYLASNAAPYSIFAMFGGSWLMLWTSVVYLLVSLVGSLASEFVAVDTKTGCTGGTGPNPCPPRLVTRAPIAWLIEGQLGLTAIWVICLTLILRNSRSGICANPSSLATAASLLHNPQVLRDFQAVNPLASKRRFASSVRNKRYRLAFYHTDSGTQRYGVVVASEQRSGNNSLHNEETSERCESIPVQDTPVTPIIQATPPANQPRRRRSRKDFRTVRDAFFGAVLLGTLALVITYLKDSRECDALNRFMNSQSFGPKFLMALIGSLIDGHWKRMEREIRVLQPFRRLAAGRTKPQPTLLRATTSSPITTFPYSLLWRDYFLALVSFTAILSEVLIVVLAGVPYSSTQLYVAFRISTYTSIAILGLMLLVLALIFWWRTGNPDMPRVPDTLGTVWSYLCWSETLLKDFEELPLDRRERDEIIGAGEKRYVFGKVVGSGGVERWVLDVHNKASAGTSAEASSS